MKNKTCYICCKEITIDSNIAKIIEIKQIQQDNKNAHKIEYNSCQDEVYIHPSCLSKIRDNINICEPVLGIIDKEQILCPAKNEESLVRNNILNF